MHIGAAKINRFLVTPGLFLFVISREEEHLPKNDGKLGHYWLAASCSLHPTTGYSKIGYLWPVLSRQET
jgi:hypothetical protein